MNFRTIVGVTVACAVVVLLRITPAAAQDAPCSQCGPGVHWVDTCSAGQDQISNQGAVMGVDQDLDCVEDVSLVLSPCSSPDDLLVIDRSGPLDVSANFAVGTADGHDDVIDTEIIDMCLTGGGVTLIAGFGNGQGGVLAASLGTIVEKPDDSARAESFFDVYVEVDLGGGNYVYNQTPLRIAIDINCVPPAARYIHTGGCIALYTNPVGGVHIANLVSANHSVNIPILTEWGMIVLVLLLMAAGVVTIVRKRRAITAR